MKTTTVGIGPAKNVFQVCALNQAGMVISNRAMKRTALTETAAQLQPTRIAMESCAGAHHWGRMFQKLGHAFGIHTVLRLLSRYDPADIGWSVAPSAPPSLRVHDRPVGCVQHSRTHRP